MSHRSKIIVFVVCILLGLFLQLGLSVRCRCAWGDWSVRFSEGAMALDLFILVHLAYRIFRRRFYDDCLVVAAIVLTSFFWIPLIYKGTTAVYLLATEGRVGELGH
jgi:hypothetical protein